ncbi:MAG TPA: hypothetical protein VEA99_10335, partial [Gemmatimonadaceae bacterium]|nr:hypothetical protein [Gemmatimonadaceae bacterium]
MSAAIRSTSIATASIERCSCSSRWSCSASGGAPGEASSREHHGSAARNGPPRQLGWRNQSSSCS